MEWEQESHSRTPLIQTICPDVNDFHDLAEYELCVTLFSPPHHSSATQSETT